MNFFMRPLLSHTAERPPINCISWWFVNFSLKYLTHPTLPIIFTEGKRCKIWLQFLTPLATEPPSIRIEAWYLKSQTNSLSADDCSMFYPNLVQFGPCTAIDGLVSSWSENIFVLVCLHAPRYRLSLWCALGLLVGVQIQVPQLQLQLQRSVQRLEAPLKSDGENVLNDQAAHCLTVLQFDMLVHYWSSESLYNCEYPLPVRSKLLLLMMMMMMINDVDAVYQTWTSVVLTMADAARSVTTRSVATNVDAIVDIISNLTDAPVKVCTHTHCISASE